MFGFQKATYPVSKIRRLRETSNPLASLAASFDRIELRIGYEELMIAVKDKEEFFAEIERRCPRSRSCEGPPFQVQVSSGRPGDRRIKNRLRES
mgnify:CR=1 FL=1